MSVATHVVKVRGTFDTNIWSEKKLKDYVSDKIENEIDETFNTNLELFNIDENKIEVWVLIFAFPSEVKTKIIEKWIKDHIKENGLNVDSFEFEKLVDITEEGWKQRPFIQIPIRFKGIKPDKVTENLEQTKI